MKLSAGLALFLLVLGAVAMGISPVFVRNAEVGPFASAFWRVFLALPALFAWAAWEQRGKGGLFGLLRHRAILFAGLFFAGDLIFWHLAILNTSIANATFFACMAPLWVALLSRVTIGESVPARTVLGLAVCLVGAVFLILHSAGVVGGRLIGDFYGIITSLFFGFYFLALRDARRSASAGPATFLSTLVTAVLLFAAVLIAGEGLRPASPGGAANLVALGLISHAGGQGLLAVALGVLSAAFSSLVIFMEAIAAALFGWLFAGEALGLLQFVGGGLILSGLAVARPVRPAIISSEIPASPLR